MSDLLTIQLEGASVNQSYVLTINDLTGRVVSKSEFTGNSVTTDVTPFANGPYVGSVLIPDSGKRVQFRLW